MASAMERIRERAGRLRSRMRGGPERQIALEDLEPPQVLNDSVTAGDFRVGGREFANYLVRLGGLRSSDRVLDVGCGTGRVAVPLLGYLDSGSYEGLDVHPEVVRWCEANIAWRSPAFRFQAVPVQSDWFNPWGSEAASEFTFPFPDSEFDFVFAVSLFTHLLAPATERYLSEFARVLNPGGRWLMTVFLVPADGIPPPSPDWPTPPGWDPPRFHHQVDGSRILDPHNPERAVAHKEEWLVPAIARTGLTLRHVHRGYWPGRNGLSYQDMIIGERTDERG